MKQKLLWALGNAVLGFVLYGVFLYLTFPSEAARDRLVYEADRAGIRMQVESVKPAWPWGVTLKSVDIFGSSKEKRVRPELGQTADRAPTLPSDAAPGAEVAATPGGTETAAQAPVEEMPVALLSFDRLTLTDLLATAMARGKSLEDVAFDADLYGGTLNGSLNEADDIRHLVFSAQGLDLARYPFIGEDFDLKIGGLFSLDGDLNIHRTKIRDSDGSLKLQLANLAISKGSKVKGFDLPIETAFTTTGGDMEVKNGRVEMKELKLESKPMTIVVEGSLMLNATMSRSRLNLKVALKFADELSVLNSLLAQEARTDDGFFHYVVSGTFERLHTRADRMASRRKGRAGLSGAARDASGYVPPPGMDSPASSRPPSAFGEVMGNGPGSFSPPELDEAERERLREERRNRAEERRKRREELRKRRLEMRGADEGDEQPRLPMPERALRNLGIDPELIDQGEIPPPPTFSGNTRSDSLVPEPYDSEPQEVPLEEPE